MSVDQYGKTEYAGQRSHASDSPPRVVVSASSSGIKLHWAGALSVLGIGAGVVVGGGIGENESDVADVRREQRNHAAAPGHTEDHVRLRELERRHDALALETKAAIAAGFESTNEKIDNVKEDTIGLCAASPHARCGKAR